MDAAQVSNCLSNQAGDVARYLLPNGKTQGREWCVGSLNGEAGESLKVCISGGKAGVWSDFASGDAGDLLELWCRVRGISCSEAFREAKAYLGVADDKKRPQKSTAFQKPTKPKGLTAPKSVLGYLNGRKLTESSIKAYKIGESPGGWIVFPFIRDGETVYIKYLNLKRDDKGKKRIKAESNCEPILFGMQTIPTTQNSLAITEGELDAMSLHEYGISAVSVPNGAGSGNKNAWIDHCWEWLESFTEIYLCMDNDDPGQEAAIDIANRLGLHRCKLVTLPKKDANECLTAGVGGEEIFKCFEDARTFDPEELRRAGSYTDQVLERFYPTEGRRPGIDLPWRKTHDRLRLYDGEVSIWTGINGHGKSLLLGQVMLGAAKQGHSCCIASMEMKPEKTLARMVQQAVRTDKPTQDAIRKTLNQLNENVWIFDVVGTAKHDRLLKVFDYAYRRYGIRQFVVDSLAKVGLDEDDYNGQKAFVDALGDFAKSTNSHVHLVAHARKGMDEFSAPGKMSVKGTGALTDMVDNLLCVYRNKAKERDMAILENGGNIKGETLEDVRSKFDAFLICDKHREDGADAEGGYGLYFDRKPQSFVEKQSGELC
ncbi:MAG: toprim domain-containing protein [Deltaproteobacteria bacterium]|nr:toprim domain-containing protein [Deltaproteobacteria bacterium]